MTNLNVIICIFSFFSCVFLLCTCYPLDADENGNFFPRDFSLLAENKVFHRKRGCDGFPCMYSHLGAKAGRKAMMRTLMTIIDDCAHDVMCSPGKRRRKRNAIKILRRHFGWAYLKDH
ncbi:uncharacterized protein LOC121381164 [Gigantopelta aegis]|uniref:uncharacterized protein LOC121381164 n=1 Tax=Gigantopelta aegis TaxID=1735272 RepID=UPI001B88825C|nr:uncharacterized protein LOC121381164 [Gigantopelta aegis]